MSCTRSNPIYLGRYKATTEVDSNTLKIVLSDICPDLIVQGDRLSFFIPCSITYPSTAINDVVVEINGSDFKGIKFGDVKWDQIRSRTCYTVVLGTEEPTATFLNDLPCSSYDYPAYTTNSNTFEVVS